MKLFTIALVVMLLLIVALGFLVVRAYNRLVSYRNRFKNAFAQINVQLTRRYDLIPNLVETAKAYMKHERETLEAVITARNQAVTAVKQASNSPDDPGAIQRGLTEVPLLHLHPPSSLRISCMWAWPKTRMDSRDRSYSFSGTSPLAFNSLTPSCTSSNTWFLTPRAIPRTR